MVWQLKDAVGLNDDGTQCANIALDQQQVAELLDALAKRPGPVDVGGTALDALPPIEEGQASPELIGAILRFQQTQGLVQNSRVDVDSASWTALTGKADIADIPAGPGPVLFSYNDVDIIALPATASGLPALTYTLRSDRVLEYDDGRIKITVGLQGPIKVDWGTPFPIACAASPDFSAIENAVNSGSIKSLGQEARNGVCSELQLQSKATIGSLFAAVTLTMDNGPNPRLGGTVGDQYTALSAEWIPTTNSVRIIGRLPILQTRPVTGGASVTLSGTLRVVVTISANEDDQQASLGAVAALAAVGVLIVPAVITGLGIAETGAGAVIAISEGIDAILVALAPTM